MNKILKHFTGQPFIFATGLAALIHSTWALGTFFTGTMIPLEQLTDFFKWVQFLNWLIPALLIAFALDVGQISTSHEIREHGVTIGRAVTFTVFAIATYYLQWLYMAHHMPALQLSEGLRAFPESALFLRDMSIWVIPALLPLSTVLYTLSGDTRVQNEVQSDVQISVEKTAQKMLANAPVTTENNEENAQLVKPITEVHTIACEACKEWSTTKDTMDSAERALRTHQALHCSALKDPEFSANGHEEYVHEL